MPGIMVIASGGGHWTQMLRLREALVDHDVVYVGVKDMYAADVAPHRYYTVQDVSRLRKWALVPTVLKLIYIVARERPAVVLTTGSAPGMLALRIGKLFGARTIWIDSLANVEHMSMSGSKARKFADLWLTQWPHLATEDGPKYMGSVL